jgi:superfamily II DNA or RNA helicase
MPTGTGKTTVFAELIRRWVKEIVPNKRVLVLVHRKELVDQAIQRLKQFGILASRIQSGYLLELERQVQVGMVQSLKNPMRLPKNLSLIVIDEAHHTPAVSYKNILKHYENHSVKLLGVTATPCRLNNSGFEDEFQNLITTPSISRFINDGYLANIKHLSFDKPDLTKIKIDKKKFDYDERELDKLLRQGHVIAQVVESYIKHAYSKKTIVFALNKAHSMDLVNQFQNAGINATYIDSDTKKEDRDDIVNKFKSGEIHVLCNVNIFTEGFDCPDIEVVQLARPTKSFALYLQQVGRVMRPFEGKEFGIILDNAGLAHEHGLITKEINWSLKGGLEIKEEQLEQIEQLEESDDGSGREISIIELPIDLKVIDESVLDIKYSNLLDKEELIYFFYDFLSSSKDTNIIIWGNNIRLDKPIKFSSNTMFPIFIDNMNDIFYKLGFIEEEQKYFSVEKLYQILNTLVSTFDYNFSRVNLFTSAYKLINEIVSNKLIITEANYNVIISRYFKIPFKSKRDRSIFIEKLKNEIFEVDFTVRKQTIENLNEFSKNQYTLYAQILQKLDIGGQLNNQKCNIFG